MGETGDGPGPGHHVRPVGNLLQSLTMARLFCQAVGAADRACCMLVPAACMCLLNFAIADADSCRSSCLLLCNLVVNADRRSGALESDDPRACQRFCEKLLVSHAADASGTSSGQPGSWNAQFGERFLQAHSCILISQSENEFFLEHIVLLLLHKYGCEQMLSSLKCPARCR